MSLADFMPSFQPLLPPSAPVIFLPATFLHSLKLPPPPSDLLAALVTEALTYPMCNTDVIQALHRIVESMSPIGPPLAFPSARIVLPKRIFRSPSPNSAEDPLPLLLHLSSQPLYGLAGVNSHSGYALTKAVYASNYPLIRFLLQLGANPELKDYMAVRIAINKQNLELVKMLVEREDESLALGKRRRLTDRVTITKRLVEEAIRVDARGIVNYFVKEKGCAPSIKSVIYMSNR